MRHCIVPFCTNRGNISGIRYFRVTQRRRSSWIAALGRLPSDPVSKESSVCSKYFTSESFDEVGDLRIGAVPSINLRPRRICESIKSGGQNSEHSTSPYIPEPSTSQMIEIIMESPEPINAKRIKLEDVCDITVENGTIIKQEIEDTATLPTFIHFDPSITEYDAVVEKDDFVDKSLLIQNIFKNNFTKILITAPHLFGKTTNMSMLKKFIEIQINDDGTLLDDKMKKETRNYKIFQKHSLSIFQDQEFFHKYFATYPVIHISFSLVDGHSINRVLDKFKFVLHQSFKQHKYLLKSSKLSVSEINNLRRYCLEGSYERLSQIRVETGLRFLSECLYKHFNNQKIFLIIDDYDGPINNTMFKENIKINEVSDLVSQIIKHALQDNVYVERAVLTGITCYDSVILYGSCNIETYLFLDDHQFAPYHGLLESELDVLLTKFQVNNEMREQVKSFYGHYLSLTELQLYPLWSVLHFLKKRKLECYWYQSVLNSELNIEVIENIMQGLCVKQPETIEVFRKFEIKDIIKFRDICLKKLDPEKDEFDIKDFYLSFILPQGYLSYFLVDEGKLLDVRIANDEIINAFKDYLDVLHPYEAT